MANKKKYCFDANIIIKLIIEEDYSDKAKHLFVQIIKDEKTIISPSFAKVEIFSVLRKKIFFKKLNQAKLAKNLLKLPKLKINYISENWKLLDLAMELAKKLKETVVYDCIYLALAQQQKAIFVTADKKFFNKAKTVYKPSLLLSQYKPTK
ncbi:type II toxin-antitoxin system VapC family toxin [Patescibacteria group bacterium]|nr:type II toxin-antitoxin system VapC family toxin [Patescibacteria group bacterium]